jgi:ABC-type multidrug transport system fused ATPase/permease subunit
MSPQPQANKAPTELEAALEYARSGIPVFPCNPLDKKPLTTNGFKDASKDEAQIHAWWQKWPNAMIGAPTGPVSGMWVADLDLDPARKINGRATLDQLIAQRGPIPETLTTITPRGGQHLIFAWDSNVEIRNSAGKIGPGVDVRGNGGYVCLPPSKNATGGEYHWVSNGTAQAVLAPSWLVALAKAIKAKAWAKAALERECKAVASAQPGTRNTTLNTAAFNLFQIIAGGGLDEQEVRDRLFEAAEVCGLVADDGTASVEATIDSGAQAGKRQPRTRPQPLSQGARPIIQVMDGQLLRILDETENALLASGLPIFSRAGMLVEPVAENMSASDGRKTVVARLRPLSPESFLGPAAESAAFQKYDRRRNAWVDTDPPLHHMRVILASERRWRFPHVTGVISIPTLRPDGSLLADSGHDPETELYLLPGFQLPPIPEHPTKDQAQAALKLLIDLYSEFSFACIGGEHEKRLNRSVALSGLLTALVRGSLPTAPMLLVRAHMAGTGKSYLVDTAAVIATGRRLFFGAKLVIDGSLTVGELVAFNMLAGRVSAPVLRLAQIWQDFHQARLSVARLGDILNTPAEPTFNPGRAALPAIRGDIAFEHVTFRYRIDGPEVLHDVSFRVPAGQIVGIVGPSGSGKSTLAKLTQRLYVPESGRVLVDGVDLAMVDAAWLRRQLGVVLQENVLFNCSVRDNIALADPSMPIEQVIAAATLAGAHEFILELPEGYDTIVGERGSSLSGGQKQRIAIARALITNPRILIFDEATSALDYESERVIQQNMEKIAKGRTVFIIAHRLSTVRRTDRIMTIDAGRLIEDGTHDDLINTGGRYASLHRLQAGIHEVR